MTKRNRNLAIGAAALAAFAAIPATASAHPDLRVVPRIACEVADFTPTGIEGGAVEFRPKVTLNGAATASKVVLGPSANGVAQPVQPRPTTGFVGTARLDVAAEGKTYSTGDVRLDCRTPPPPTPTPPPPPPVVPPPVTPPPAPPATCAYLKSVGAGPATYRKLGFPVNCVPTVPPLPPPDVPPVCARDAQLTISQPGTKPYKGVPNAGGFFYTQTYRGYVKVRNTSGAPIRNGKLRVNDGLYQRFVRGGRTDLTSVGFTFNLAPGASRTFGYLFGFNNNPAAFLREFVTTATLSNCGRTIGRARQLRFEDR